MRNLTIIYKKHLTSIANYGIIRISNKRGEAYDHETTSMVQRI